MVKMFSGVTMEIFLGGTENEMVMGEPAGKFFKKLFDDLSLFAFTPLNLLLGPKLSSLGFTNYRRDL